MKAEQMFLTQKKLKFCPRRKKTKTEIVVAEGTKLTSSRNLKRVNNPQVVAEYIVLNRAEGGLLY